MRGGKKITMQLNIKKIKAGSILLISVPILIFLSTWLKIGWAVPVAALFIISVFIYIRSLAEDAEAVILVSRWDFLLTILICMIFIWLTGLGGGYYQMYDNHARNAIFRDLINESWPVIYEKTGNALVYYHTFWMFPALIGKAAGWYAANMMLYIQGVLYLVAIVLNVSVYMTKKGIRHKLSMIAVMFIVWGGLNILGQSVSQTLGWCNGRVYFGTNEGWLDFARNGFDCSYLYRSNYDAIGQVYNQAFPAWLVILMYLNDQKTCNCAFLGLCLLPYGPIPFVGAFAIIAAERVAEFIKMSKIKKVMEVLKQFFSIQNTVAIGIGFIFLQYFSCSVPGMHISGYVPLDQYDYKRIITLCLFWFFEFGVYSILIFKENKKNLLFWAANISLLLIPFIKVGYGRDFCMNASLPALILIMVYVLESLCKDADVEIRTKKYQTVILITCLAFSAVTPAFGIMEKVPYMRNNDCFPYVADDAYSYSERNAEDKEFASYNYLCPNPDEKLFYKIIAKRR